MFYCYIRMPWSILCFAGIFNSYDFVASHIDHLKRVSSMSYADIKDVENLYYVF